MNLVNSEEYETSLSQATIAWLRQTLPSGWQVEPVSQGPQGTDWSLRLTAPDGTGAAIAVEEKTAVSPRTAADLLSPLAQRIRSLSGSVPLLVVAPWLSKRTQEILAEQEVNYIDLTGNALLRIDNPALFIRTNGAARDPEPKRQGKAQLRGPKAGRLIRFLVDVSPPYNVSELAAATKLTPGYVSRLLDTLYGEALIERPSRGAIKTVDIAGLIRRWASSYDVFRSNEALSFIAPAGLQPLLEEVMRPRPGEPRMVISGSFAAAAMAPVAPSTLLIGYCDRPAMLADELNLLPTDEAADVVLLGAYDEAVWQRTEFQNGKTYAAPAQVAVDCLTGNGRMPAEGEAMLEWMLSREDWRAPDIAASGWV